MITAKQARYLSEKVRKSEIERKIIEFKKSDKYQSLQKEILEATRKGLTSIFKLKTDLNYDEVQFMEELGYKFSPIGFDSNGRNYIYW